MDVVVIVIQAIHSIFNIIESYNNKIQLLTAPAVVTNNR